jgi:glycine dehydrogenase subunit 1
MLDAIGVSSVDDLFLDIPENLRIARLNLPDGASEWNVSREMRDLAARNANLDDYACFLGAGAYDHFIPAVVRAITSRGEFSTPYTPYQPEVSQGTLQAIFEYQSLICALTGMDVSNASMYDGASGFAEAGLLCLNVGKRTELLVSESVHPEYRQTLRTYLRSAGTAYVETKYDRKTGVTDLDALRSRLSPNVAGVLVQHPNFFGCLEPMTEIGELARANGSLFVASVNPVSLGALNPPSSYGADVVVGEGQSLGNPIAFGGPYLGFFAVTDKLMRRIPGRLAGETHDLEGRRACLLTLRAREQDIRREKATSNICTNQALNALAACVHLSALGKSGFRDVAVLNARKAHYARDRFVEAGFPTRFAAPFFNEFAVEFPGSVVGLNRHLLAKRLIGGLPLGRFSPELERCALVAVTENRTRDEIDRYVEESRAFFGV